MLRKALATCFALCVGVGISFVLEVPVAYAGATVPGAPTGLRVIPGKLSALVEWTAPSKKGGSPITEYRATAVPSNKSADKSCTTKKSTSCTLTGLTDGVSYGVTVKAENSKGFGPASAKKTFELVGVPSAPKDVTVAVSSDQATVSWKPASNNGATITGYTVTSVNDSVMGTTPLVTRASASALKATVYPLTNGDTYTFKVSAKNSVGTGPAASSKPTTLEVVINGCAVFRGADLAGCNLSNADLFDYDLTGANLSGANLSGANLGDANLTDANLTDADLTGALLAGPDCPYDTCGADGANLTKADLTNADLTDATMSYEGGGANLTDTNLAGVDLVGTTLSDITSGGITGSPFALPSGWEVTGGFLVGPTIVLHDVNLSGVDLTNADLAEADLMGSNLTDATLSGTNLANADLAEVMSGGITGTPAALPSEWSLVDGYLIGPGTNLNGADLAGVNLMGIDLVNAEAAGIDLESADLSGDQLFGNNFTGGNLSDATLSNTNMQGDTLSAADLTGADLTDADLVDATLANTDLAGAVLTGVSSGHITGTPSSFPADWSLVNGYLAGPGANLTAADLTNADLNGVDLANANLSGVTSGSITGVPAALPDDWSLIDGYLIGPSSDLAGADLANANLDNEDLTSTDLKNADLQGASLAGVTWSNTTCPDGTNSNNDGDTCVNNLG